MALDALLARFEGRAVTSVTAGATPDVTPKPAPTKACTSVTSVTAQNDDTAGKATSEPLSDPARLGDGGAPEAELVALVDVVADFHGFNPEQRAETQQIAQADPVAALECFRDLAARIPGVQPTVDDRIMCNQCANLAGRKCTKWEKLGAARGWEPVQLPLRCEQFKPKVGEGDQRTGAERWPNLKKEQ